MFKVRANQERQELSRPGYSILTLTPYAKDHTDSGIWTAIIKSTSKIYRTEVHFKIENEEGRSVRLGNGLFPLVSLGNHSVAKQSRILEELFLYKGSRL